MLEPGGGTAVGAGAGGLLGGAAGGVGGAIVGWVKGTVHVAEEMLASQEKPKPMDTPKVASLSAGPARPVQQK